MCLTNSSLGQVTSEDDMICPRIFNVLRMLISISMFFCLFTASCSQKNQTNTSGNPEVPLTGFETWEIDNVEYIVEGTAYLIMKDENALFIIKVMTPFKPNGSHKQLARLFAIYANSHGYLKKMDSISYNGRPVKFSGAIGVALFEKQETGITVGWKYNFTLEELSRNHF